MTIGILTAVWKRPLITHYCLSHALSHKVPGVTLKGVAVASEERTGIPEGWEVVRRTNFPLGKKWNRGLLAFKDSDVDGIVILGSDDLITTPVLEYYAEHNPAFATLAELFVLDSASMKAIRIYRGRIGAGRYVRRDVLEAANWKLWDDGANKSLDRSVERTLKMRPEVVKPMGKRYVLDIKSATNIWPYAYLADNTRCEAISATILEPLFHINLAHLASSVVPSAYY